MPAGSSSAQGSAGSSPTASVLLVRADGRACALPLQHVAEIMRWLGTEAVPGAPEFVSGLSVIRGAPTPVADLGVLLGSEASRERARVVSLKVGGRSVALAVDEVVGVRRLEAAELRELPPLLDGLDGGIVAAIGVRDAQLSVVLRAARLIPDEAWAVILREEAAP